MRRPELRKTAPCATRLKNPPAIDSFRSMTNVAKSCGMRVAPAMWDTGKGFRSRAHAVTRHWFVCAFSNRTVNTYASTGLTLGPRADPSNEFAVEAGVLAVERARGRGPSQ